MSVSRVSVLALLLGAPLTASASGELVPTGAASSLAITDHDVRVVINNGFARTEVIQTFHNPGDQPLEATYRFPLPEHASMSEMAVTTKDGVIRGEVVGKEQAKQLYEDAKAAGRDAALATKNGYTDFTFQVARVPAHDDAVVRFVYYQPLDVDTGVGRYVYPMEPGGNDEGASFWTNTQPAGDLSIDIELKTAFPIADVRLPGAAAPTIDRKDAGHVRVSATLPDDSMDRDLVFYYKLADDLPGRIEVTAYKPSADAPGTFMLVVTPAADLKPLERGADYVFLLDVSGSMSHTIHTLNRAVSRALPELRPEDRFRIVTFSNGTREIVPWTPATPENVARAQQIVAGIGTEGGTNLYQGLQEALRGIDDDRATSLVLVTDAVANEGEVRPEKFHQLLQTHDVRMFSFLMGNGGNWPLMNVMTDATGGFATGVSNEDDILGQILLARSKMGHQALHDARLSVGGLETWGTTDEHLGKVFRGEQLIAFGRYDSGGTAKVSLDARVTGVERSWTTTVALPDVATDDPEIERLWALAMIEQTELERDRGDQPAAEASAAIRELGVDYQLVTDETSMVALTDADFEAAGVDRNNRDRVATERAAQDRKAGQPARDLRADSHQPAFPSRAPTLGGGGGGGAIDPVSGTIALGLGAAALWRRRSHR